MFDKKTRSKLMSLIHTGKEKLLNIHLSSWKVQFYIQTQQISHPMKQRHKTRPNCSVSLIIDVMDHIKQWIIQAFSIWLSPEISWNTIYILTPGSISNENQESVFPGNQTKLQNSSWNKKTPKKFTLQVLPKLANRSKYFTQT